MATALNQALCGCTEPWRLHQQIVTYYTDLLERGLFVVTWWVRAHGLCRTQVLRLSQDTCRVCGQRHWCGRGDALHTWEHNAAPAAGSNLPAITVDGLGEAHAWAVVQVRAGQAPPTQPSLTITLQTGAHGQVSISLEVDTTRDTVLGQGTQRHPVRQVVALYRLRVTGTADAHGRFSRRVAIAYQPRTPLRASIAVTVRMPQGTATGRATATLLPLVSADR